jgi:hypothetical protein
MQLSFLFIALDKQQVVVYTCSIKVEVKLIQSNKLMTKINICPACGSRMHSEKVMNALSRYAPFYICSGCGAMEALHGFFWKHKVESNGKGGFKIATK